MGRKSIPTTAVAASRIFNDIYANNAWGGEDSSSGTGSDFYQTRIIAKQIPTLLSELGVATILDVPCGDFYWMSRVALNGVDYTGADIVDALIRKNRERHERPGVRFRTLNLTADRLPRVDLILCRDCLVHLPFADALSALKNICRSGSEYILTTTFPDRPGNTDIVTGDWQPLNLERAPFGLPPPQRIIREGCTEGAGFFADKSLGLWRTEDVSNHLRTLA